MFLWFLGISWVSVWSVFRSPALDYRLVMLGSVLPVLELFTGSGPLHAVVGPIMALTVVMLATIKRRLVRRRWLGLVVGLFAHQVFDGCWMNSDRFWWPLSAGPVFGEPIVEADRWQVSVVLEMFGLALLVWAFGRFRLDDAGVRRTFLATGQLDRRVADGEELTC